MSNMDPAMRDNSDDELMLELKQAVATQWSAPETVMEAAKAAFDWRGIDAELEVLSASYDSLLAEPVGVRGPSVTAPQMLVFDSEHVTIELELGTDVIMGQVIPAESNRIILERADGSHIQADTDDAGVFLVRRPTRGPIRLRFRHHHTDVATDWISV
jgi:hypothetical protein